MTTEKGNKIIAEFDGWTFLPNGYVTHPKHSDHGQLIELRADILQYHLSWDWLMPVVEKIESLWISGGKTIFKIEGNKVQAWHTVGYMNTDFVSNMLNEKDGKIKNLWLAVIEFINWYNTKAQ